jgi:prevent-host-death family protein
MLSIGVAEAKKRWSEILREAASGKEIAITRRGKIVGLLVPVDTSDVEPTAAGPVLPTAETV